MRGVATGGDGNHSGSLPSVGTYLDEQPVTTIGGTLDVHIYDIARIESLAGPQGTLYGASSQAGTIRIDGRMVAGEPPAELRDAIAYVPQDAVFFDGDLRRNMRALAPGASDAAIWEALHLAEADAIPAIAAAGLDARLGEMGQQFSGGERQRLGLARAILRRPRLLILDEALSALDRALERRILARLTAMSNRMTIMLVTHRPPSDVGIDRVLLLKDGVLSETCPAGETIAPGSGA